MTGSTSFSKEIVAGEEAWSTGDALRIATTKRRHDAGRQTR